MRYELCTTPGERAVAYLLLDDQCLDAGDLNADRQVSCGRVCYMHVVRYHDLSDDLLHQFACYHCCDSLHILCRIVLDDIGADDATR
jgi:hypothetical protein